MVGAFYCGVRESAATRVQILARHAIPPRLPAMVAGKVKYEDVGMRALFLMVTIAMAASAFAADGNGRFAPKGAGLILCESFVAEHAKGSDAYLLFRGWIDGYVTAVNRYETETFDILALQTPATVAAAIDNHCSKNPQDPVLDVMLAIVDQLRVRRIRAESRLVRIENRSGDHVLLYEESIRAIRTALAELGYPLDPDDGVYDDRAESALRGFQATRGLEATGLPDQATLWELLGPLGTR